MSYANRAFAAFLAVAVTLCSLLFIQGCGGGGGSTGSATDFKLTPTPVDAQVSLPAGTPISDLGTLTVWSAGGATPLSASGLSNVTIYNGGPQYTDVRDSAGRLVLLKYLSSSSTTINAESTAEALVFFAVGGATQVGGGALTVLQGVKSFAGFGAVVDEVEEQLAAQGYISFDTGNLKARIQDIIDSIGSAPATNRGTIAEPTYASGLFLDTITDGEFKIQNNYLRRARGWLRQVSYVGADGIEVEALGEYKKFDIEAPARYGGLTNTVYGILTGNMTWQPTVSEALPIPLAPANALETKYELKTFGLGASFGLTTEMTVEEKEESVSIAFKSLILDATLPVIANIILPLNGDAIDKFMNFVAVNAVFTDLINIARETVPEVYDLLNQGKLREAITTMWDTGFTSNTMLPLVMQIAIVFWVEFASDELFEQYGDIGETINSRLKLLGYVDVFFSSADMAIFTNDFLRSDRRNLFTIRTTRGKATLVPESLIVPVFDTTLVNAVIQNKDPNAIYKYEWSVSDGYRLTTSNGNTNEAPGGVLASNDDWARISTETDDPGTAIVTCKVTRIDGEPDRPIDQPSTTVEFVPDPSVTPETVGSLLYGQSVEFEGHYDGPHTPLWKYTLETPELGTINRTTMGTSPDCTFIAGGTDGTAKLKVEMYLKRGAAEHKVYTTTRNIPIGAGTRVYAHATHWTGTSGSENFFATAVAYVSVPKTFGTGTYNLYRNGTLIKSWASDEDPTETPYFTGWRNWNGNPNRWSVELETRHDNSFTSPNAAESYGRIQSAELYSIYVSFGNVYTIKVVPE